jgi:arsenate reductase-like glutaredoxin family protein
MIDVAVRPPAPGELRRFAQRLGSRALLDVDSRAYRDAGLGYLTMDDAEMFERVLSNPALLRLPLVRFGEQVTIGVDEAAWKSWMSRD